MMKAKEQFSSSVICGHLCEGKYYNSQREKNSHIFYGWIFRLEIEY